MKTIATMLLLAMNCLAASSTADVSSNTAPVRIESVVIDGHVHAISPQSASVTVPAGARTLEFRYTAIDAAAAAARFRYLLRGLETYWVDAGTIRIARYSGLPPGRYLFEAQAADATGAWMEPGSTVAITIEPHITGPAPNFAKVL